MLVARGKLENRQAIINIGVQRFSLDYQSVEPTQPVNAMPMASYRALLDTGAQRTCLTHRAIEAEGLRRHGKRFIKNVHNQNVHSLFMVRFGIWCCDGDQMDAKETNEAYFGLEDPVEVINIANNERFDAIVGMDVLGQFNFNFTKSGEFQIQLI